MRLLAPNFVTLLSLCAGLTAIRMAIEQRFDLAVGLVLLAGMLDGVDGRVARALKAQSRFGAELDSLADFVNFGVAPAVLLYIWGLGPLKGPGWIAVLLFACGMGLRLARFNAAIDSDKPRWHSNYFTGVPAPAGALCVLLPMYLDSTGLIDVKALPLVIVIYTIGLACMLVSTIPTFSGKLLGERIPREMAPVILIALAAVVGALVSYPYQTLTIITLAYLTMIPMSWLRFRRQLAESVGDRSLPDAPSGLATTPLKPAIVPTDTSTGTTRH
jgi:CDP-diacylglycerol--serine O-phosphatidyltransferase